MHLEAEIESLKDALRGCNRAILAMHLKAEIKYLGDALGGRS
jgi:hypothetical protein